MEEKEETLRQKLRYDMRLRVSRTDHAFGPGVAELMEHVEATGSLSKGCKCQTVLTPEGKEFLKRYRKFEQEVRAGADASFQKWFGTEEK